MKKARRIKAGVLAFTAVVSVAVTSVPVYAVEDSPVVYDLKAEQKNQENLEYDQAALDLLKYCNKDDFKTWDQSLAPMNDAQAQEIKTFVDDQIVKGETEDYKKASYSQWAVDELRDFIAEQIYPRREGSIEEFCKLTHEFMMKTAKYARVNPNTSLMFRSASEMAANILDLLRAME